VRQIPLSSPDVTDAERNAVLSVLAGRELSLGPRLPEFERIIAERLGSKHAVAVNSGTSGLHLCVKAAHVSPGDEVITTPFSFVASANSILFEQGRPVFIDIDPLTYNIDPGLVEAAITPKTRAILPVHVFGRPCGISSILEIAGRRGLQVIEDSCEAIGATVQGKSVGTFGQTGVFAFYPNKQITTGEGGVVVTNDDTVAMLCRSWRNQGRGSSDCWLQHERLGYNYRLSDINCALGIAQMRRLDDILARRARVARLYDSALAGIGEIVCPRLEQDDSEVSWFVYVVRLQDEFTQADRDTVIKKLRERGIGSNNYFSPIHLQPFYRDMFGYGPGAFPVTERVAARTFALPFFTSLSEGEIGLVADALKEICGELKGRGLMAMAGARV
jgi:perosamine synthetase